MLAEVCKNPKSPGFNHYLFESVAALVRYGVAADPANLTKAEDLLFPAFDSVLTQDVQEFHPYVFQVLAQLIELSLPPLRQVSRGGRVAGGRGAVGSISPCCMPIG
jgi:exportin-2 (importin alpha re-exporter)